MTDISVVGTAFNPENLSWDLTPDLDARYKSSGTIDITKFDAAKNYPNGFIPSGTVLQKDASTGLLEPYAAGGAVAGILAASVQVMNALSGQPKARIGVAVLEAYGVVSRSAAARCTGLASGTPGALDAAAEQALPRIHFVA